MSKVCTSGSRLTCTESKENVSHIQYDERGFGKIIPTTFANFSFLAHIEVFVRLKLVAFLAKV